MDKQEVYYARIVLDNRHSDQLWDMLELEAEKACKNFKIELIENPTVVSLGAKILELENKADVRAEYFDQSEAAATKFYKMLEESHTEEELDKCKNEMYVLNSLYCSDNAAFTSFLKLQYNKKCQSVARIKELEEVVSEFVRLVKNRSIIHNKERPENINHIVDLLIPILNKGIKK